ncbi:hypothetical protein [Acinetobacter nectaris]|uniref:hypothetical protein n=1 Tax=Acinetobacter nectaris TaxID=1219382 RepID=UPI001F394BBE|nr:hypothetical protein [Acinetobacter nectaris]MCF9000280.1 hypothetical protein [Acinetobacter nectaris]MCF9028540.1 hypothetical protein [Acinetobacter nectaris]
MKLNKIILCSISIFSISHIYAEDEICKSYIGQEVSGNSFDFYYQKAKALNFRPKNEFESTSAYKQFLDSNITRLNLPKYIIVEIPIDRKEIRFDADNWVINIGEYSMNNANTAYGDTFLYKYSPSYSSEFDQIEISREVKPIGNYVAATAFGGKVLVNRQQTIYKSIFDKPKEEPSTYSITQLDKSLKSINVSHDDIGLNYAKSFKQNSKAYAVISLKPPYAITVNNEESEATLNDRVADTIVNKVLFADIKCLVMVDQNKKTVYSQDVTTHQNTINTDDSLKLKN